MTGSLTFSPADVVAQLLIDLGLGTDPTESGDWPVFVSEEPDTPDDVITIYDTVGTREGRSQIDGEVQEHEGIQIRIRSTDYDTGHRKTDAIKVAVDITTYRNTVGISSVLGTGTMQYFVQAISRISMTGGLKESPTSKRNVFTINAVVALREV